MNVRYIFKTYLKHLMLQQPGNVVVLVSLSRDYNILRTNYEKHVLFSDGF